MAQTAVWAGKVLALVKGGNTAAAIAQIKVAPSVKDLLALKKALAAAQLAGRWADLDAAVDDNLALLAAPRLHLANDGHQTRERVVRHRRNAAGGTGLAQDDEGKRSKKRNEVPPDQNPVRPGTSVEHCLEPRTVGEPGQREGQPHRAGNRRNTQHEQCLAQDSPCGVELLPQQDSQSERNGPVDDEPDAKRAEYSHVASPQPVATGVDFGHMAAFAGPFALRCIPQLRDVHPGSGICQMDDATRCAYLP